MNGVNNLAPFSCFTVAGLKPARVCVSIDMKRDGQLKDTLKNMMDSKDFVINAVDEELALQMNQASCEYPSNVDEFKEVGLTPLASKMVNAPMVAESPVKMECIVLEILEFGEIPTGGHLVIGEVLLVHLRDDLWDENRIDIYKLKPIGRVGGELYCRMTDLFEMKRPYTFE